MTQPNSTATAEAAKTSTISHIPMPTIQAAPEQAVDNTSVTGQQVVAAVGNGSPYAPPRNFRFLLDQMQVVPSLRTSALLHLQRSYGNSYVGGIIQCKCECSGGENCTCLDHVEVGEEPEKKVQRQGEGTVSTLPDGLKTAIQSSEGKPLGASTRTWMESRFGQDFSEVNVHTDNSAAQSARQLNAQAFTIGRDIYFSTGRYQPETLEGQRLLAHELTHVVQHGPARSFDSNALPSQSVVSQSDEPMEREAEANARQAVNSRPDPVQFISTNTSLLNAGTPIQTKLTLGAPDDATEIEADQAAYSVLTGKNVNIDGVAHNHIGGVIRRLVGWEHWELGTLGSSSARTNINLGPNGQLDFLTFGEMEAIAGDYFGSLNEIKNLAQSEEGKAKLRWAVWHALTGGKGPKEPQIDKRLKQEVLIRYYALAVQNISHYQTGGGGAKFAYENSHRQALAEAFDSGYNLDNAAWDKAMTREAFGSHYLTDMFSAGHVRVERAIIKAWYEQHYRNVTQRFITYIAQHMRRYLLTHHRIVAILYTVEKLEKELRKSGGPALTEFSLGDLVSGAWHDYDNERGLKVVSVVHASGLGPEFTFTAMGDSKLRESPNTMSMALAAIRASIEDLKKVRTMGAKMRASIVVHSSLRLAAMKSVEPYAAERFIPREAGGNVHMDWHWGYFNQPMYDAVNKYLKGLVADMFREVAKSKGRIERDTLNDVADHFANHGIEIIENEILHEPARGLALHSVGGL